MYDLSPGATALQASLILEEEIRTILRVAAERRLPSLLIGANAIVLLGYIRNTIDLDLIVPEESRSQWLDLLGELGYRLFHGASAFAQFEAPKRAGTPVDLMFVDQSTWAMLIDGAKEMQLAGQEVLLPRPEHLVALKLHAIESPTRGKPGVDWEDIRQIVRICALDPDDQSFRAPILRYGGEDALEKSAISARSNDDAACNLELPVFDAPLADHWPLRMSWSDAMRALAPFREYYMHKFDSPEQRLRARNPQPFRLD